MGSVGTVLVVNLRVKAALASPDGGVCACNWLAMPARKDEVKVGNASSRDDRKREWSTRSPWETGNAMAALE